MSLWVTIKDSGDEADEAARSSKTQSSDECFVMSLRSAYNLALELSSRSCASDDISMGRAILQYESIIAKCRTFLSIKMQQQPVDCDPTVTQIKEFLFLSYCNLSRAFSRCRRHADALRVSIEAAIMIEESPSLEPLDVSQISRISTLVAKVGDVWTLKQLMFFDNNCFPVALMSDTENLLMKAPRIEPPQVELRHPANMTMRIRKIFEFMVQLLDVRLTHTVNFPGTSSTTTTITSTAVTAVGSAGAALVLRTEGVGECEVDLALQQGRNVQGFSSAGIVLNSSEDGSGSDHQLEQREDQDRDRDADVGQERNIIIPGDLLSAAYDQTEVVTVTGAQEQECGVDVPLTKPLRRKKSRDISNLSAVSEVASRGIGNLPSLKDDLLSRCSTFDSSRNLQAKNDGILSYADYNHATMSEDCGEISELMDLITSSSKHASSSYNEQILTCLDVDSSSIPHNLIDKAHKDELHLLRQLWGARIDELNLSLKINVLFIAMLASFVTNFAEAQLRHGNSLRLAVGAGVDGVVQRTAAGFDFTRIASDIMLSWSYIISVFGPDVADVRIPALLNVMTFEEVILLAECAFDFLTAADEQETSVADAGGCSNIARVTLSYCCSLLAKRQMCNAAEDGGEEESCLCALRFDWLLLADATKSVHRLPLIPQGVLETCAGTIDAVYDRLAKQFSTAFDTQQEIIFPHRAHEWQLFSKPRVQSLRVVAINKSRIAELEDSYEPTILWLEMANDFLKSKESFLGTLLVYFTQCRHVHREIDERSDIIGRLLHLSSSLRRWDIWVIHASNILREVLCLFDTPLFEDYRECVGNLYDSVVATAPDGHMLPVCNLPSTVLPLDVLQNLESSTSRLLLVSYNRRDERLLSKTAKLFEKVYAATSGLGAFRSAARCLIGCFVDSVERIHLLRSTIDGDDCSCRILASLAQSTRAIVCDTGRVIVRELLTAKQMEVLCLSVVSVAEKCSERSSLAVTEITTAVISVSFSCFFSVPEPGEIESSVHIDPDALLALHQISMEEVAYQYNHYQVGIYVIRQLRSWLVEADGNDCGTRRNVLTLRQTKEMLTILGTLYFILYRFPMAQATLVQQELEGLPPPLDISDETLNELHQYTVACESHFPREKIRSSFAFLYECPSLKSPQKTKAYEAIRDILCADMLCERPKSAELVMLSQMTEEARTSSSPPYLLLLQAADTTDTVRYEERRDKIPSSVYHDMLRCSLPSTLAAAASLNSSCKDNQQQSKFQVEHRILKTVELCLFDLMLSPGRFDTWTRLHGCLAEWFHSLSDEIAEMIVPEQLSAHIHLAYGDAIANVFLDGGRFADIAIDEWTSLFGTPLTAYRIFEVAGLRRHYLADDQKEALSIQLCRLIALKNAVFTMLDNLTNYILNQLSQSDGDGTGSSVGVCTGISHITIDPDNLAKVAEAHGVAAYIRGHDFSKSSDSRKDAYRRSLRSFKKVASQHDDNSFAWYMIGKLTMILESDLSASLLQLRTAASTATQNQKALRLAIQYTTYSTISKQCLLYLDPRNDGTFDITAEGVVDVVEPYSFSKEPSDAVAVKDGAGNVVDRLFRCLADALAAILDCRKRDQYHSASVYRLSKIIAELHRLTCIGVPVPPTFRDALSRLGLTADICSAWAESEKLFDKKRTQIVALWCVETASDGYELILQRTCKFDCLRRKFIDNHLQLAVLNDKLDSVMELAHWILANRKDTNSTATLEWMGTVVVYAALRIMESRLGRSESRSSEGADLVSLQSCYVLHQLACRRLLRSQVMEVESFLFRLHMRTTGSTDDDEISVSSILLRCAQLWPAQKLLNNSNKRHRSADGGAEGDRGSKKSHKSPRDSSYDTGPKVDDEDDIAEEDIPPMEKGEPGGISSTPEVS